VFPNASEVGSVGEVETVDVEHIVNGLILISGGIFIELILLFNLFGPILKLSYPYDLPFAQKVSVSHPLAALSNHLDYSSLQNTHHINVVCVL
jgi:hypothetical protein